MSGDIMSLMVDMMPMFKDLMALQAQNLQITKLHVTIKNPEIDPNRIYLIIDTDANSKPIAQALTNMLKNMVEIARKKEPSADIKVFV